MVALDAVPLEPHVDRDRVIHLQRSRSARQSESDRPRCTNMQQARHDISVGLGTAESSQQLIATHPKRLVEADPVRAAVKVAAGDRGALRIIRLPLCAKHASVKAVGDTGKRACARTVGADKHPVHLDHAWSARLLNVSQDHNPRCKNVAALTVRIVAAEADLARLERRGVELVVRERRLVGVLDHLGVPIDELVLEPLRLIVRAGVEEYVNAHWLLDIEAQELQVVRVGVRVVVGGADAVQNTTW